ncbi:MAG: hypothetical protein KAR01_00685, partial [Desulfocapsa sp.]|nr:hypothetical protein [Desulfocapsa sp.]
RTNEIDPDEYVKWVFPALIAHRRPLYERITEKYGYTIDASKVLSVKNEMDVMNLLSNAL